MSSTLYKIRKQRLEKIKKLRVMGINPFPARSERSNSIKEIVNKFEKYKDKIVTIAGRILSFRSHGSLKFIDLEDFSGKIQLIIKEEKLKSKLSKEKQTIGWEQLELVDIGDFFQVKGVVIKSNTGEISIDADELKILTKAIRPLPEKWEGIREKEIKFRRRYLDLATNKKSRELFRRKSRFWNVNREFMNDKGFIELNTPILEHVTGGADANPFVTHHDALDQNFYMRISPELHLKRLIGGGFEKVYTIGACFRNEGIDDEHLQEYYTNEWYWAYADYRKNMSLVKDLYRHIAKKVYGKTKFKKDNYEFDLAEEWKEIDYVKIIKEKFGIDVFRSKKEEMMEIIKKHKINLDEGSINRFRLVDNIWKIIRKEISGPVFLINEPKFVSPLAKLKDGSRDITERFHVIIAGSELGNGYSELNDPIDQYDRFKSQQEAREKGDSEAQMMDVDFVEMLEYGMPPTTGFGMSERLFWFLENVSPREGTLFPQTRYHLDETTKEIYNIKEPRKVVSVTHTNKFIKKLKQLRDNFTMANLKEIRDEKIIKIDKSIEKNYENINVGIALIRGVKIVKMNEKLEGLKREVLVGIRSTLSEEEIDDISQIKSYHNMYKKMGVDTNSRKSSPEALLRRITSGDMIYRVNTCVDSYNIAVLLTQISVGAFDLSKVKLPVVLREAKEGEEIEIIGGEIKKIKNGEVCYFDQKGAYNIDYNWRDAERTKVTESTEDLFINVEGVNSINRDQVADALRLSVDLITNFCGGKIEIIGMVKSSLNTHNDDFTVEKAKRLLNKYVKGESLLNHCEMVAKAMKGFAKNYGEDEDKWYITGLLHDFDYEKWPDKHPQIGKKILVKEGVPSDIIKAIQGHADYSGVQRDTKMAKVLYAVDELCGLIYAVSLMRPSGMKDMKVKSVMKKFKANNFAAKIDRKQIKKAASELGIELSVLIKELIDILNSDIN